MGNDNIGSVDKENVRGYSPSQRDYFAGIALGGMLAHSTRYKPRKGDPENWHEAMSKEAYDLADKMIACGDGR